MTKNKTTLIKDVVEGKSGISQSGRSWTIWQVLDADDVKYGTFSERYKALIGQEVTLYYEEKQVPSKDGKRTFLNRQLVEPNEVKASLVKPVSKPNEAMEILKKVEAMVYDIHQWIESQKNL